MKELVLADALEAHQESLQAMGKALIDKDKPRFVTEAIGLVTTLATEHSVLGAFAKEAIARAFGESANAILSKQAAEWEREQSQQAFIDTLAERVEDLLGQALIQIVKSQHDVKQEVIDALGGLREDLAGFRTDFANRLGFDQHIEHELVVDGATGVRIRAGSSKRVFVRQQTVSGAGTVGVEIE